MITLMVEVPLDWPVDICREFQAMPITTCSKCGKLFWSIPSIDLGVCPGCQMERK